MSWGLAAGYWVAPGWTAGIPVIAVGLEWLCPNGDAPNCYLHWQVTESGYGYCPVGHGRARIRTGLDAPSCSEQLAAVHLLGVNELQKAVHVRYAACKATTQRDGRAALLGCTARRRASAGEAARRSVVLPYRGDMPARKRPAPEDTVTARQILLDGLARDADIFELTSELAALHPRDNTFPGEVFLHVAADALDWCGASRR